MENKRFFGIHFDFHAGNDVEIGVRTNPEDIQKYIDDAKPTFIQCDCKGHPGNSSYPTKVGKAADKLKSDNLRVWCDVAKKNNIPLFMHYSGVLDIEYEKAHPEKAHVGAPGEFRNEGSISLFSDYVDDLIIPQMKELIDEYGVDGIWVDGDCWAVRRDFSDLAKPYIYEGISEEEHNKIMHDAFLRYVKRYVDEIHAYKPDLLITSNWMYTSYIPEKPEVDIDFISGDYPACDSLHSARYEARSIAKRGKPWDLMAWSFGSDWDNTDERPNKPAVQLCQEAAMTITLGGGFQIYENQNKDGSAKVYDNGRFRELGEFMHKRRINFEKLPIAQVALFYSAETFYKTGKIFNASGVTEPLIGTLNAVLDAQYTADIVMDYQIDTLCEYDIVVVPQWQYMGEEIKNKLLSYAKSGGHLLAIGAELSAQMGKELGESFEIQEKSIKYIKSTSGLFTRINLPVADLKRGDAPLYETSDLRDTSLLLAYRTDALEKGSITYIPFDFGDSYFTASEFLKRDFLKGIMKTLAEPVVSINKTEIDITMQEEEKGFLVNLINMNQGRRLLSTMVYDVVPEIYNIEVIIKTDCKKVSMPLGEEFESEIGNGFVKVKLPRLDIHSIIRIEK